MVCQLDGTYAYIDTTGSVVAEAEAPSSTGTDFSMYYEDSDGYKGLLDDHGNPLTGAIYDYVGGFSNGAAFVVLKEGEHKSALIDRSGNILVVLPDNCNYVNLCENGLIWCQFPVEEGDIGSKGALYNSDGTP